MMEALKDFAVKLVATALVSLITWYVTHWDATQEANQTATATRYMMESITNKLNCE